MGVPNASEGRPAAFGAVTWAPTVRATPVGVISSAAGRTPIATVSPTSRPGSGGISTSRVLLEKFTSASVTAWATWVFTASSSAFSNWPSNSATSSATSAPVVPSESTVTS